MDAIEYIMGSKGRPIQKGGRAHKQMLKAQAQSLIPEPPSTRVGRGPPPLPVLYHEEPEIEPVRKKKRLRPQEILKPTLERQQASGLSETQALMQDEEDEEDEDSGNEVKTMEDYGDEPDMSDSEESDSEEDEDVEFTQDEVEAAGKALWTQCEDQLVEGYQALGGSGPKFNQLMETLLLRVLP